MSCPCRSRGGTKEPLCWLFCTRNRWKCRDKAENLDLLLLADPFYPLQTFQIFFPNQPKAGAVGVRRDGKGGSLSPIPLELLRSLAKSVERAGIGSQYLEKG